MRIPVSFVAALVAFSVPVAANDRIPAAASDGAVVIDGVTVHPVSGAPIENARVRFSDGRIEAVGPASQVSVDGAERIDGEGRHLYPGFIAANSVLGLAEVAAVRATVDIAEVGANNANVRAEVGVNPDSELFPVTRANGVLLALTVPQVGQNGVIAGTSALIAADGWTWEDMTRRAPVGLHVFWPSEATVPSYLPPPARKAALEVVQARRESLDTAFDAAKAYASAGERDGAPDLRLAAMQPVLDGDLPLFVHAVDAPSIEAAVAFADERGVDLVVVGAAEAWRVAPLLAERDVGVILGGTHVLPMRRDDPVDAIYANAKALADAGVRFAIATPGDSFDTSNLRNLPYHAASAVAHGLPRDEALRAITQRPAELLGVGDRYGTIEPGKSATFFLVDGDPLDARSTVSRAWIDGRETDLSNKHDALYRKYREKYRQSGDLQAPP